MVSYLLFLDKNSTRSSDAFSFTSMASLHDMMQHHTSPIPILNLRVIHWSMQGSEKARTENKKEYWEISILVTF